MDGTDIVFTGELSSALCGYTLHLTTFDIYFHYGITGNDFASTLFDDTGKGFCHLLTVGNESRRTVDIEDIDQC